MSEFKREERYRVIKLKTGSAIDCVVVEADWPEYEIVWGMIQARMEGKPNELEQLRAELASANHKIEKLREALHDYGTERQSYHELIYGEFGYQYRVQQLEADLAKERERVKETRRLNIALMKNAMNRPKDCPNCNTWGENEKLREQLAAAQATIAEMREALKLGAGETAAMADDWQTVPREPTDAMEQAGWDVEELRTPNRIYRAMLAAAPVPHNA